MFRKSPPSSLLAGAPLGILCMIGSAFLSAIMNSATRHVAETLHPFEIVFFRNFFSLFFVIPVLTRYGFAILNTKRLLTHFGRSSLNVINHLFFFTAVSITPLAEVVALGFSAPIFATVFAIFILRELVGWRRWAAILAAFCGTLVILRPGLESFTYGHGVTLIAAATWAGVLLFIKSLGRTEHSITIVAYATFFMTPLSSIPALFVWQWPTMIEFIWLAFIGFTAGCAQFLISQALREADLTVVMPFDFTKLIWVSVVAFIFFDEIPDIATWIGGLIIFIASLYVAHREARNY